MRRLGNLRVKTTTSPRLTQTILHLQQSIATTSPRCSLSSLQNAALQQSITTQTQGGAKTPIQFGERYPVALGDAESPERNVRTNAVWPNVVTPAKAADVCARLISTTSRPFPAFPAFPMQPQYRNVGQAADLQQWRRWGSETERVIKWLMTVPGPWEALNECKEDGASNRNKLHTSTSIRTLQFGQARAEPSHANSLPTPHEQNTDTPTQDAKMDAAWFFAERSEDRLNLHAEQRAVIPERETLNFRDEVKESPLGKLLVTRRNTVQRRQHLHRLEKSHQLPILAGSFLKTLDLGAWRLLAENIVTVPTYRSKTRLQRCSVKDARCRKKAVSSK